MKNNLRGILEELFEECERCAVMGEKVMCIKSKSFKECPVIDTALAALLSEMKKSQYRQGHGNKKCSNCKQPLSKCVDIDATGQSFACKHKH